jgi:hypothetical protein
VEKTRFRERKHLDNELIAILGSFEILNCDIASALCAPGPVPHTALTCGAIDANCAIQSK